MHNVSAAMPSWAINSTNLSNYIKVNKMNENLKNNETPQLDIGGVITPLLTDKEIEEYIWEEIPIALSQIDIDTHSDGYIRYLNAVHWAKWGRDNCNGL